MLSVIEGSIYRYIILCMLAFSQLKPTRLRPAEFIKTGRKAGQETHHDKIEKAVMVFKKLKNPTSMFQAKLTFRKMEADSCNIHYPTCRNHEYVPVNRNCYKCIYDATTPTKATPILSTPMKHL